MLAIRATRSGVIEKAVIVSARTVETESACAHTKEDRRYPRAPKVIVCQELSSRSHCARPLTPACRLTIASPFSSTVNRAADVLSVLQKPPLRHSRASECCRWSGEPDRRRVRRKCPASCPPAGALTVLPPVPFQGSGRTTFPSSSRQQLLRVLRVGREHGDDCPQQCPM